MLADEPPITITERRDPAQPFFWDARQKHVLVYTEHFEKEARADGEDPTRPGRSALGLYIHDPGWDEGTGAKRLVGFPPRREDASAANALRAPHCINIGPMLEYAYPVGAGRIICLQMLSRHMTRTEIRNYPSPCRVSSSLGPGARLCSGWAVALGHTTS